jgi:hypothetical protein
MSWRMDRQTKETTVLNKRDGTIRLLSRDLRIFHNG